MAAILRVHAQARGFADHVNSRSLHSGSKAQEGVDPGSHGMYDPDVYVLFWAPASKSKGFWHVLQEGGAW